MQKTIYTENQKKAHDISRHLSVTANAGSGKTTVLVSRYIDILLNTDTKIDEIVAITFTEKAAGELKKKIADSIEGLMTTEKSLERKKKIEYIRNHLSSANVSTIHSFCSKILRQFPVEANVDFAFTILDGIDKEIIESESVNESIKSYLTDSQSEMNKDLIYTLKILGKNKVQNIIKILLSKREQVERWFEKDGIYNEHFTDEMIFEKWEKVVNDEIIKVIDDEEWKNALLLILNNINSEKVKNLKIRFGESYKYPSIKLKFKYIEEVIKTLFTTNGTLNKNVVGRKLDTSIYDEQVRLIISSWRKISNVISVLNSDNCNEYQKMLLKIIRIIIFLYKDTNLLYEKKKSEYGYLDYEDLQLKTRMLLENEEIRKKLWQKYKYIMIDEYQDTNLLQYEIFLPLLNYLKNGNLFIVGDPKQSIFAFRNAEVEVFENTKRDIKESIILGESFRLLTDIVCFVNTLFSIIMTKPKYEFEVEYEELIKGRNNHADGRIELMLLPAQEEKTRNEKSEAVDLISDECEMIARRILKLYESKYSIFDKSETAQSFEFKDAAILLRSRTYLSQLEKTLNKYRIPYIITGGIGFYQTQEIFDFYNYFQFLLNNHDDAALVGVLRSPFFTISDSELYEIAIDSVSNDFWTKAKTFSQKENSSVQLKRAVNILADNIEYANRLSTPILVQRILRQTGWLGTISGITRGEQSRLNVEKLLRIAREFEGKGFTNLFDFVERLRTLISEETREGQASIETEGNAVQIMTIHSAKGLEFPVVFIPFCHKEFRYDNEPFIDHKLGLGIQLIDEADPNKKIEPLTYTYLKTRSHLKTEAEEKRIFYVACTRAKDMLVLSGNLEGRNVSYLNWILESLNIDCSNITSGEKVIKDLNIKVLELIDNKYHANQITHDLRYNIYTSVEEIALEKDYTKTEGKEEQIEDIFIEPLQAQIHSDFFSATQIQTFLECPVKYLLKHRLGIPEHQKNILYFDEQEDSNDKIRGEIVGSLVHKILEKHQTYDEDLLCSEIKQLMISESEYFDENIQGDKYQEEILKMIKNLYNSEIGKEIFSNPEFKTEFTINTTLDDNFLIGTIDRLFKDSKGQWFIVDYKTDSVKNENMVQKSEKYKPQLCFYALLVNRLFKQRDVTAYLVYTKVPDLSQRFLFTENDIEEFENTITNCIKLIRTENFEHNKKACNYCGYLRGDICVINR